MFDAMKQFIECDFFMAMHNVAELHEICDFAIEVCYNILLFDHQLLPSMSREWYTPAILRNLIARTQITRVFVAFETDAPGPPKTKRAVPANPKELLHIRDRAVTGHMFKYALDHSIPEAFELFLAEDMLQVLGHHPHYYNKNARKAVGESVGAYVVGIRNSLVPQVVTGRRKRPLRLALARDHLRYVHHTDNLYQTFASLIYVFNVSDYRVKALAHIWPHTLASWGYCTDRLGWVYGAKQRDFMALLNGPSGGAALSCSATDAEDAGRSLNHTLGGCKSLSWKVCGIFSTWISTTKRGFPIGQSSSVSRLNAVAVGTASGPGYGHVLHAAYEACYGIIPTQS